MGTIGPNSFIGGVPTPEPPLGPGGEEKLIGPGGTPPSGLLGPGGQQHLIGPGGVQHQQMNIDPSAEGIMPILPPTLSSMQSTITQLKELLLQADPQITPEELQTQVNSLAKQLQSSNITLQQALPQYQQIQNLVVGWVQEHPEIQTQLAHILPIEPGPEIGGGG